jgi:hypothetical protein
MHSHSTRFSYPVLSVKIHIPEAVACLQDDPVVLVQTGQTYDRKNITVSSLLQPHYTLGKEAFRKTLRRGGGGGYYLNN